MLSGVDTARVGEIAARSSLVLHELVTRTASLEEAFFEATDATEETSAVYSPRLQPRKESRD